MAQRRRFAAARVAVVDQDHVVFIRGLIERQGKRILIVVGFFQDSVLMRATAAARGAPAK